MDVLAAIPYFIYLVMIGIIAILLYSAKRATGIKELKYLIWGFIFIGCSMLQYTGMIFLESEENQVITQRIFSIFAFIAVLWGWNLLLFGFRRVTESPIPKRYYLYLLNNSIIVPSIFSHYVHIQWAENKWEIVYSPSWTVLFVAIGIFSLIIETTYLFASVSKYSGIESVHKFFYLYAISILLSIPLFVLRNTLGVPVNFYLIPVNISFLIYALLIYYHPEVFQTSYIKPQFLMILQRESGMVLKMFHFIDNNLSEANSTLMASALTALQYMFQEMSGNKAKLTYLGMPNTHLSFCYSENYLFVLGSERKSTTLSSILTKIQQSWTINIEFMFSHEDEIALDEIVRDAFIYQINRLNLFLESENTHNHYNTKSRGNALPS